MKSLSESLFDGDLISKETDDMVRIGVQNQLREITKLNPNVSFQIIQNRDGTESNVIRLEQIIHPTDTSTLSECRFLITFEIVFIKNLKLYAYLSDLHFFVQGSDKLQRKYNNYLSLNSHLKPKPPYIKSLPGLQENVKLISMRHSKEINFLYDDLKQIIKNFYDRKTISLMQQYTDTYMETGKRPTPIMNKIAGNVCKIYSKFNY